MLKVEGSNPSERTTAYVAQRQEAWVSEAQQCQFESDRTHHGLVAQLVEAMVLEAIK